MKCRVNGCNNKAMYKAKQLCQKHYSCERRNGTTEILNRKKKDKCFDDRGYVMLYKPNHPIATKKGLIREHRYIAYEKYKNKEIRCEICLKSLNWGNLHVDHIDEDKANNNASNLRILCRACNVMRTSVRKHKYMHKSYHAITCNGVTKTAAEWARTLGVSVCSNTIIRRIKDGWDVADAIWTPSKKINTNKKQKTTKYQNRYEPSSGGIVLE